MITHVIRDRLFYASPGPVLDSAALVAYHLATKHHPDLASGRLVRFIDFSRLRTVTAPATQLQDLAWQRSRESRAQAAARAVIYAPYPLGFGFARMYQTFFASETVALATSADLVEALEWLRVPDLLEDLQRWTRAEPGAPDPADETVLDRGRAMPL